MWLSEIKDCIDNHIKAGMSNPFFNYDDETLLWFVDFNRVGKSAKKINKGVVIEVVSKIVSTFNIEKNMGCKNNKFYSKYIDAINLFYSHRKRPHNRKILNPTLLSNMAGQEQSSTKLDYNIDKIKNFTLKDLKCC